MVCLLSVRTSLHPKVQKDTFLFRKKSRHVPLRQTRARFRLSVKKKGNAYNSSIKSSHVILSHILKRRMCSQYTTQVCIVLVASTKRIYKGFHLTCHPWSGGLVRFRINKLKNVSTSFKVLNPSKNERPEVTFLMKHIITSVYHHCECTCHENVHSQVHNCKVLCTG